MGASARRVGVLSLALLLAILPLWVAPWTVGAFEPAKVDLLRIWAFGMAVLWILARTRGGRQRGPAPRSLRATVALGVSLGAAYGIATALSIAPNVSLWGSETWRRGTVTFLCQVMLFLVAVDVVSSGEDARRLLFAVCLGSIPVSLYAIAQILGFDPVEWTAVWPTTPERIERSFSTLGNPNILGGYLAMALPIAVGWGMSLRRTAHKIGAGLLVLLQLAALLSTFSRGSWLAAAIGMGVLGLVARKKTLLLPIGLALIGLLAVVFVRTHLGRSLAAARPEIWQCSLALIRARPLLGYGPETLSLAVSQHQLAGTLSVCAPPLWFEYAHNLWLDTAVEIGALGFVVFVAFLVALSYTFFAGLSNLTGASDRMVLGGMLSALAAYVVQMQFMFPTVVPTTLFWVLAGTSVACVKGGGDSCANGREVQR